MFLPLGGLVWAAKIAWFVIVKGILQSYLFAIIRHLLLISNIVGYLELSI